MKKESPPNRAGTEGNIKQYDIDLAGNKPLHSGYEHFLLTLEYQNDTILKYQNGTENNIFTLSKSMDSIKMVLNSIKMILCYGCVDIICITKDNSHRQSRGKVVYLGR